MSRIDSETPITITPNEAYAIGKAMREHEHKGTVPNIEDAPRVLEVLNIVSSFLQGHGDHYTSRGMTAQMCSLQDTQNYRERKRQKPPFPPNVCSSIHPEHGEICGLPVGHGGDHYNQSMSLRWTD